MTIRNKKESLLLFLGDAAIFAGTLWLTLLIRYRVSPSWFLFRLHLSPFSILFLVWVLVYFIAGLYDKHVLFLKGRLPNAILKAQIVNTVLAVGFFYFIPYFGITPKVNLFIYLGLSLIFILIWRLYGYELFGFQRKQKAVLVGRGEEMREVLDEVNNSPRYNLKFVSCLDLDEISPANFKDEVTNRIRSGRAPIAVIDTRDEKIEPLLPHLYNFIFSRVSFIALHKVYEDMFDRVPLSLLNYDWFLENLSLSSGRVYDVAKRAMDVAIAFTLGIASLPVCLASSLMIKLDDGGPIFSYQRRVGQDQKPILLIKFRTMERDDGGKWARGGVANKVTRVGKFLRRYRLDEFPQLWNVLKGDLSLIGPRPEFPEAVASYEKAIPYYNIRHLIKPGLSGWAQIYHEREPHHGVDIRETKVKLSYDIYYIKNRSLMLDLKIALKTLKILASRSGL